MAAKMPERNYTCEICGLDGLNDESMRVHMTRFHLEGALSCPFCDLNELSQDELLIHVYTTHLDYLTCEDKLSKFLFDNTKKESGETSKTCQLRGLPSTLIHLKKPNNFRQVNNINNNNTIDTTTNSGMGARSSPSRTQLNLNLREGGTQSTPKNQQKQQCFMCSFSSASPSELEEHMNRIHFDLTSPNNSNGSPGTFRCPICLGFFVNSCDLELHVNIEHKDILSPNKSSTCEECPVCCRSNFKSHQEMVAHVEQHFNKDTPVTPDLSSDRMLAKEIEQKERETRRLQEQKDFEQLQAQYGMDNQGNFREQSLTNMQRAVYAGEMSVTDFYERQLQLRFAENNGIDDGRSCTKDLISKIKVISGMSSNVIKVFTCTTVDHYASTYGDKGWGCGYRNLQMLFSSLIHHTAYNDQLYKPSLVETNLFSKSDGILSRSAVPSISKLQQHIEWAWRQGFDVQGCDQLGGKLHNTRKWIGATEIVTVLSSLGIRCQLIDFNGPTSPDGSHPELFKWVFEYFKKCEDFKPPLYLQHQGHSRTIVGVEQYNDGHINLLVFDPSHTPEQMNQLKNISTAQTGMRLIRKSLSAIKARQYQLVVVRGIMDTEIEYQQSQILKSIRIS